jgi:hypothetical protein
MLAQVTQGLTALAHRTAERFPDHVPFKKISEGIDKLTEKEIRETLDDYLLPVAPQLQKKNLDYFKKDPTFAFLELENLDVTNHADAVEEVFTVLNQILLLQSTMSLLPPDLMNVAQSMAAQLTGAIGSDGQVDQAAIGAILSQAMSAAGVLKTPISKLDPETATGKLKLARKQLM